MGCKANRARAFSRIGKNFFPLNLCCGVVFSENAERADTLLRRVARGGSGGTHFLVGEISMLLLIFLFVVPFISAVLIFLLPIRSEKWLKRLSFFLSLIPIVILSAGYALWPDMKLSVPWFPALSIYFDLRVDTLSLLFLYLTFFIIPVSFFAIKEDGKKLPNLFFGMILLLQGLLVGFFTAGDLVVFTFFWEAMIIPLYFIIALWGGQGKREAALKFFIYMVAGSALLIAGVLSFYFMGETFLIRDLTPFPASSHYAGWVFGIFVLAFAVKTPLFPFHAWLPDAYSVAPTAGSILLAGILSKAGIYGFVRITAALFPDFLEMWRFLLLPFAITGVLYGAFAAWGQKDFKRLVAYSSLSHVNFIIAGLFVLDELASSGAILQAINHGVTIAGLFLVAWWLEERINSTEMENVRGLTHYLPRLSWLTLFFVLSSVGLPGLNNFVGEFLILFGYFMKSGWIVAFLTLTVILSVVYMLRWMQNVYFDAPVPFQDSFQDIGIKEIAKGAPLILVILWIGIYPAPILKETLKVAKIFYAKELKSETEF